MLRITVPGGADRPTELEAALARLEFLAEAGAALATPLPYETALASVARLAVPFLSDWCIAYVLASDGSITRLAIEHATDEWAELVAELEERFDLDQDAPQGIPAIIRNGEPVFFANATAERLALDAVDPEGLAALLEPLGIVSWMAVPLLARGETIGALSFISTDPDRIYGAVDLAVAQDLAHIAAFAVDSARLSQLSTEQQEASERTLGMLDALLAGSPIGIAFLDTDLRYVRVNPALARIKGRDPESFVGLRPGDVIPSTGATIESYLRRVLAEQKPLTRIPLELRIEPGGVIRHVEGSYYPVRGSGGEIIGVGAVVQEVTERKRVEGQLRESRALLQGLFDHATDAIMLSDDQGRYVDVNAAACKLLDFEKDQLVGRTWAELYPGTQSEADEMWRAFLDRGEAEGEFELRRRDGRPVFVEARSVANFVPGCHLSILRDVTMRHALEEDRERSLEIERIARASAERSRDLIAALQKASARLARDLTPRDVSETVLVVAMEALDAVTGMLALAQGETLKILGWRGYPDDIMQRWSDFPIAAELPLSEAVRTGDVILISSKEERDARYPSLAAERMAHPGVACIPLFSDRGPSGGVALSFAVPRRFDDEERLFMLALGEACGQALERARLYEAEAEARRRAEASRERIESLAEASKVLNSSLDVDVTLSGVAGLVVPKLADWCAIHIVDPDGTLRAITVAHADPSKTEWVAEMQARYPPDPDAPHGVGNVVRTGTPEFYPEIPAEVIERLARDAEHLEAIRSIGMRSALSVPLVAGGETVGAITMIASAPDARYTEEDLDFAMALAQRAGQAIENARLFQQVQAARSDLQFSNALLRSQGEATIDGILVTKPGGPVLSFNGRFCELWGIPEDAVRTEPRDELLRRALERIQDPEAFRARRNRLEESPYETDRGEVTLTDGRVLDHWSAPLLADDGSVLGRAWYFRDITEHKITERVLADSKRRADFLAEASALLASSLDPRTFLRELAHAAVSWVADWCVVDTLEPDGYVERVAIGNRDPDMQRVLDAMGSFRREPLDPDAAHGVHHVIRSGSWEFVPEVKDEWLAREAGGNQRYLAFLREQSLCSSISVPMVARGKTVGAITLVAAGDRAFGPADLAFAQELGARAGAALDNARLFQDRAYIARTLQTSLLPHSLPLVEGIEIGAAYHAAGEAFEVGGDFYDVFELGRECVAVIGDVCGKGPDAAATTALTRHTLRAAAVNLRKPSKVLLALNDAMLRAESPFATVAFVRLRPTEEGAKAWIGCGGHPLPLLVRPDGRVEPVGAPGTLVGAFEEPTLEDVTMSLAVGETLVLYTDGVTEARAATGEGFGEERLVALLSSLAGRSAVEVAREVERTALDFQGGEARDDIAVLALKVT